jgi:hypothetical protein
MVPSCGWPHAHIKEPLNRASSKKIPGVQDGETGPAQCAGDAIADL